MIKLNYILNLDIKQQSINFFFFFFYILLFVLLTELVINLILLTELGQLSGVAAILRFPIPDDDEDSEEEEG